MQHIYRFIMYLVLFLFPLTILAANHLREEIINLVVDPCYLTLASENDELMENISAKKAVELIKVMQPENVQGMVDATYSVVKDVDDFQKRMSVYNLFRDTCINAGRASR